MQRLIGKYKLKDPGPSLNESIDNIDKKSESLAREINLIDIQLLKIREQMKNMREGAAKNIIKRKALNLIRKKKVYESQYENLSQQSFNMEQTNLAAFQMENAATSVQAMKSSAKQLKKSCKELKVKDIDDVHDDLEDFMDQIQDIQEALGHNYGMPDVDEDELDAELESLGDEISEDNDTSYLDVATMSPNPPSRSPEGRDDDEPPPPAPALVDEFGLPNIIAE